MITAIFQVRMGSTRLPNKSLMKIKDKPLLWYIVQRVKNAKKIDKIVIATTYLKEDKKIVAFAKKMGVASFAGSEKDVLDRFYQAAKKYKADVVVRVTADDPFKDPKVIDELVEYFLAHKNLDYVSNTIKPTYPEGLDIEVFSFKALEKAWHEAKKSSEREHVTPYIWKHPKTFKIKNITNKKDFSKMRWTIDYPEDLEFAKEIYKRLYSKKKIFLMQDILDIVKKEPELLTINQGIKRNQGYFKSLKEDKKYEK